MNVPVRKTRPNAIIPALATSGSAGADLRACIDAPVTLAPGQTELIPIGLAFAIPLGYAGLVFARSGMATRRGLAPANKVGVLDSDYRGEVFVPIHNHSSDPQTVEPGERIAQLILVPAVFPEFSEVETLDETDRGESGFGSTGRQ